MISCCVNCIISHDQEMDVSHLTNLIWHITETFLNDLWGLIIYIYVVIFHVQNKHKLCITKLFFFTFNQNKL
jgi:hypothetical protein